MIPRACQLSAGTAFVALCGTLATTVNAAEFQGYVDVGGREVSVRGDEGKYRQHIDLDDGARLFGLALRFEPSEASARVPDLIEFRASGLGGDPYESLDLQAPITIEAWVYLDTPVMSNRMLVRKTLQYQLSISVVPEPDLVEFYSQPLGFARSDMQIDFDRWVHVAVTFDGFEVPAENLLVPARGDGLTIAYHGLNLGRVALCATAAGSMRPLCAFMALLMSSRSKAATASRSVSGTASKC